ncbi:efflux RND transporter periplasmic adaptor subunit [Alteromonas sp. ASW11-36]|uniref:Efflux RND transporter periplasmic adaptor subunit n=1 Tax=Alteromonas arenosi TaxID=3055817 RepID=A0ABT7SXR9_9ALTE|nr:efflux RND transporter periplasmic adaptor subunit [Alteromonas sp. ASW11-36]MDM7860977.1 efflux RND transporter periplasmic adaptor subunit [Alteromonas sp. ASW11-36]
MKIEDTSAQDEVLVKRAKPNKAVIITAAVILTLGLFYYAAPSVQAWSTSGASVPFERLRIATVTRGDLQRDLSVQGRVVAAVSPTVYSPASGTVTLKVEAGDDVSVGQVIAVIDSPELDNRLSQEQAVLEENETALARQRISAKKAMLENQKAVDIANVALIAADREKRRADKAFESQSISSIDFEKAQDDLQNAQLVYEHAVKDAELDAESLAFEIRSRELQVERQRLLVSDLQRQVNELQVISPVNGIIGNLAVEQKNQVIENQVLLSVVDLSEFELEVDIPESYADDLAIGMLASVSINGVSHPAQLVTISPEIENNQVTGRVRFAATDDAGNPVNKPLGLRQNQRLTTRILMENKPNVLLVQRGQFLETAAGRFAYVITDNTAQRTAIRTGARSLSAVEIIDGLNEGDQIIISSTDQFDGADAVLITQ